MGLPRTIYERRAIADGAEILWRVPPGFHLMLLGVAGLGGILFWGVVRAPVGSLAILSPWLLYLWAGRFRVRVTHDGIEVARTLLSVPFFRRRFTYGCEIDLEFDWDTDGEELTFLEGRRRSVLGVWGSSTSLELRELIYEAVDELTPPVEWLHLTEMRARSASVGRTGSDIDQSV